MSFSCKKCNLRESLHELELSLASKLIEYRFCQKCYYWFCLAKAKRNIENLVVVIDDVCYIVGEKLKVGNKFVIRFRNNKQITTYNLIYMGKVPKRWNKSLYNNARFVKTR